MHKLSSEEIKKIANIFFAKMQIKHGNKYNFDKFIYINSKVKGVVWCNDCEVEFLAKPNSLSSGSGCPECKKKTLSKLKNTSSTYKDRFNKIHGIGTYDYSRCKFGNSEDKVEIGCKVNGHGYFWQTPYAHYKGSGCPLCADDNKAKRFTEMNIAGTCSREEILERFRIRDIDGVFGYDDFIYKGFDVKGDILCKIHNKIFRQTPSNHLAGSGCPLCANEAHTLTTEQFKEKSKTIHNDRYDYHNSIYTGTHNPIIITCREEGHGDFVLKQAGWHISGKTGCPKCANAKKSQPERDMIAYLSTITSAEILESKAIPGSTLQMDAWIPSLNLAVEYNGLHWHSEESKKDLGGKDYHLNKTVLCESNGIHLIHIYEDDWLYKEDVVKSLLNEVINGISYVDVISLLKVKLVEDSVADEFINRNSLFIKDVYPIDYWIGLYDDKTLCSVMAVMEVAEGYEIHRFCDAIDHKVSGSFERLIEYVRDNINPDIMIGYMDRSWHKSGMDRNCYLDYGFEFVSTLDNISYIFDKYERKRMISEYMGDIEKDSVIWNSGSFKYVWHKP